MIKMNLYNISIISAITGVVLLTCYILIRIVVSYELKKSLPSQIKTAQDYFKKKNIRLTLLIKSNGEVEWEHFDMVKELDYVG